jgi:hypothetical protein
MTLATSFYGSRVSLLRLRHCKHPSLKVVQLCDVVIQVDDSLVLAAPIDVPCFLVDD